MKHAFDFWAGHFSPTWSWDRPLARLAARSAASATAATLVLEANRHWRGALPGQHVNVTSEIDGVRVTRSYSPTVVGKRQLAITVKRVDGGAMSRYLCDRAALGTVVELSQAYGELTLPPTAGQPALLLAAGSGITPLMAMLRARTRTTLEAPITLAYWCRRRDELCFVDELRALAARDAKLTVRFMLTGDAPSADDERAGRLDVASLEALLRDAGVADVTGCDTYACGPYGFVELARALLETRARTFAAEAFSPPVLAIEDGAPVTVTLAATRRTVEVPRGMTLLAALESIGVRPASGCRMGICNTCACGKRAGITRNTVTGEISHDALSALKLCINTASSDLVLEL